MQNPLANRCGSIVATEQRGGMRGAKILGIAPLLSKLPGPAAKVLGRHWSPFQRLCKREMKRDLRLLQHPERTGQLQVHQGIVRVNRFRRLVVGQNRCEVQMLVAGNEVNAGRDGEFEIIREQRRTFG